MPILAHVDSGNNDGGTPRGVLNHDGGGQGLPLVTRSTRSTANNNTMNNSNKSKNNNNPKKIKRSRPRGANRGEQQHCKERKPPPSGRSQKRARCRRAAAAHPSNVADDDDSEDEQDDYAHYYDQEVVEDDDAARSDDNNNNNKEMDDQHYSKTGSPHHQPPPSSLLPAWYELFQSCMVRCGKEKSLRFMYQCEDTSITNSSTATNSPCGSWFPIDTLFLVYWKNDTTAQQQQQQQQHGDDDDAYRPFLKVCYQNKIPVVGTSNYDHWHCFFSDNVQHGHPSDSYHVASNIDTAAITNAATTTSTTGKCIAIGLVSYQNVDYPLLQTARNEALLLTLNTIGIVATSIIQQQIQYFYTKHFSSSSGQENDENHVSTSTGRRQRQLQRQEQHEQQNQDKGKIESAHNSSIRNSSCLLLQATDIYHAVCSQRVHLVIMARDQLVRVERTSSRKKNKLHKNSTFRNVHGDSSLQEIALHCQGCDNTMLIWFRNRAEIGQLLHQRGPISVACFSIMNPSNQHDPHSKDDQGYEKDLLQLLQDITNKSTTTTITHETTQPLSLSDAQSSLPPNHKEEVIDQLEPPQVYNEDTDVAAVAGFIGNDDYNDNNDENYQDSNGLKTKLGIGPLTTDAVEQDSVSDDSSVVYRDEEMYLEEKIHLLEVCVREIECQKTAMAEQILEKQNQLKHMKMREQHLEEESIQDEAIKTKQAKLHVILQQSRALLTQLTSSNNTSVEEMLQWVSDIEQSASEHALTLDTPDE